MTKLEPDDGKALKVALVERLENGRTDVVRYGPLSSARVEVVALHGNFNAKDEESWSPEEFQKHIVSGREKSAQLLTGNLALKLSGGEAVLENATFTDNSSFTSTKMFRLGLRLVGSSGERVLEGITKPFRVKERRVEGMRLFFFSCQAFRFSIFQKLQSLVGGLELRVDRTPPDLCCRIRKALPSNAGRRSVAFEKDW